MPVRTDLCELAQQVVDEFADFRPDHAISFTCDALPPGMWDADRLTQLLSNLAMHAMDHTAAGLPIALRMTARDQGVQFEVHFPTVPTADSHEEPTENFAQDVVDQIVRAHRGTFHVHADAAQTRFVVWLPQRQASDDEVQRE
jgi:signal transduction histidine kinase